MAARKKTSVALRKRLVDDTVADIQQAVADGEARLARGDKAGWNDILSALVLAAETRGVIDEARSSATGTDHEILDGLSMHLMAYEQQLSRRMLASLQAGFFARLTGS